MVPILKYMFKKFPDFIFRDHLLTDSYSMNTCSNIFLTLFFGTTGLTDSLFYEYNLEPSGPEK